MEQNSIDFYYSMCHNDIIKWIFETPLRADCLLFSLLNCFFFFCLCRLTEQLFVWVTVVLSLTALLGSDITRYPFSGRSDSSITDFVGILLAINIGRYIYLISVNVYLYGEGESSRIKTEAVHHVVTIVCYSFFLAYHQNLLLSLVGMTMETNSTIIEISKILKEMGKNRTKWYSKLSFINCALTLVFRGVVPVVFLVIAMFHETPFVMHYTTLTVFFLSIIFFSVINVWLILATIQRLVRSFCKTTNEIDNTETIHDVQRVCHSHLTTRNNLGYLRRYDNKNLCMVDDEKLNTNRKETTKENFPNLHFLQNGMREFIPRQTYRLESEIRETSLNATPRTVESIPLEEVIVDGPQNVNVLRDSSGSDTSVGALIGPRESVERTATWVSSICSGSRTRNVGDQSVQLKIQSVNGQRLWYYVVKFAKTCYINSV